jgi:hypothetical protein
MSRQLNYKKTTEPFIKLNRSLLKSLSWQRMSVNCRRLVDFLMLEHLGKGGKHNGELFATYDQLVASGISRRLIHPTLSEAEHLGLIRVERGRRRGCTNHHSKFLVTFLPLYKDGKFMNPLDDWKEVKLDDTVRKSKSTLRNGTSTVPLRSI